MKPVKIIVLWVVASTLMVISLTNRDYFLLNLITSNAFFIATGLLVSLLPIRKSSYKQRISITIPAVMLLFSLYIIIGSFISEYGLFSSYNYFTARTDLKNGKIQLIRPGLIRSSLLQQEKAITRKYGFSYVNSGCVISDNGFEHYNAVVADYLTQINGEDWRQRLDIELDSLYKTETQN